MTTTSPEEIERQHRDAAQLAEAAPAYASPPLACEIPIASKRTPPPVFGAADGASSAEPDDQLDAPAPSVPCWSSRGHVDVTALADLLREGYNQQEFFEATKAPPSPACPSNGDTDGVTKEEKESDESAPALLPKPPPPSDTNLWDPRGAARRNVAIRRPSHDAWGIGKVVLVFADDFLQGTYELPYYELFREHLRPVLDVLRIEEAQVVRLLFASLPPGVTIPVHQDSGAWVQATHRVHAPILVHDPSRVVFRVGLSSDDLERIDCAPGHVFEINNSRHHAVSNCDSDHRVHMILDYMDGSLELPERHLLKPGQVVMQTRRSLDLLEARGQRPTPSYIILGAQKAGTTSLYECLVQHPLVIPAKRRETHLFDWRWIAEVTLHKTPTEAQRVAWMHKFFHTPQLECHPSCLTGDSTPSYLLDSRRVIPRIQATCRWPLRFFVMLRDPVRRAESHFAMATSPDGTAAQLRARGMEWRSKPPRQVVTEELQVMRDCGLIPYFNVETGIVDQKLFEEFSYTVPESEAWDRYMQRIPLNTGSHSLLGRGLYELQLRPWFQAFPREHFLVIQLERMKKDVHATMERVWKHLQIPPVEIEDVSPKNQRSYEPIIDDELAAYLQRFYEPHNRRLKSLLGSEWDGVWA